MPQPPTPNHALMVQPPAMIMLVMSNMVTRLYFNGSVVVAPEGSLNGRKNTMLAGVFGSQSAQRGSANGGMLSLANGMRTPFAWYVRTIKRDADE
eukprot:2192409-Karenia_brevis.AAC.2